MTRSGMVMRTILRRHFSASLLQQSFSARWWTIYGFELRFTQLRRHPAQISMRRFRLLFAFFVYYSFLSPFRQLTSNWNHKSANVSMIARLVTQVNVIMWIKCNDQGQYNTYGNVQHLWTNQMYRILSNECSAIEKIPKFGHSQIFCSHIEILKRARLLAPLASLVNHYPSNTYRNINHFVMICAGQLLFVWWLSVITVVFLRLTHRTFALCYEQMDLVG